MLTQYNVAPVSTVDHETVQSSFPGIRERGQGAGAFVRFESQRTPGPLWNTVLHDGHSDA